MTISVRIICMDYYMATPGLLDRSYTPFSAKGLTKVPVIRVFGSTLAGQKVCLHIHQVYPYFFIPYPIPKECKTDQDIQKSVFKFGTSLNEAMNLAKPNAEKDQHIVAIVLAKGVPFYGYHVGYQSYLKIYLANPYEKQQMIDILQSEAILDTRFQPHEAHLNFELQFLMDHNLYGMDWLHINEEQPLFPPSFRLPLLEEPKSSFALHQSSSSSINHSDNNISNIDVPFTNNYSIYTSKTVPEKHQSNAITRDSYCELEIDITGMSIMNRLDLKERDIHANFEQEKLMQHNALVNAEEEAKKKLVKSLESIWKDEASRRKSRGIFDPIPPVSQTEERDSHVPWISEPSLRKSMQKMLDNNNSGVSNNQELFDRIPHIMTIFEAVEALYPEEYQAWKQQYQHQETELSNEEAQIRVVSSDSDLILSNELKLPSDLTMSPHRKPLFSSQQFNITATPSRYKALGVSTQLDKSIIDTLARNPSFQEDREDENEEDLEDNDNKDSSVADDDDYFDNFNHISSSEVAKWMEETEKKMEKFPTTLIEYSDEPPAPYRPRKLDFIAEAQKIDDILLQEKREITKKQIFSDLMESDNVDSTQNDSYISKNHSDERISTETNDDKDLFVISDVPPDPTPWPHKHRKKKHRIDQLDGLKDEKDHEARRAKRQKSAAEKWELEMKALRKMRKPKIKKSNTEGTTKDKSKTSTNDLENKFVFESIRRVKSYPILPEQTKKTLKAEKIRTETSSSSLPPSSLNDIPAFNPKNVTSSIKKSDFTSDSLKPSLTIINKTLLNIPDVKSRSDTISNSKALSDQERQNNDIHSVHEIDDIEFSKVEIPSEILHSSFFQNSIHSGTSDEASIPSQGQKRLRSNSTNFSQRITTDKIRSDIHSQFNFEDSNRQNSVKELIYKHRPPVLFEEAFPNKGLAYKVPYYSKERDLPRYPTVFGGKEFKLPTSSISSLKEFQSTFASAIAQRESLQTFTKIRNWVPTVGPPKYNEVQDWIKINKTQHKHAKNSSTQLNAPTGDNKYGFKVSATKPQAKVRHIRDYIDYFSLEIHVNTRENMLPDPHKDAVQLIFWCLQTEDQHVKSNGYQDGYQIGVIALNDFDIQKVGLSNTKAVIDYAESEEELFTMFIAKVRYYDPDMLTGYEVQNASWGYLVERGVELGFHLLDELSRVMVTSETVRKDQWGSRQTSAYRVYGRHVLNIWRLMKGKISLTSYTFENIAYHLLRDRIPHYSYSTLTKWYLKGPAVLKYRLLKYYLKRVQLNLDILDASQVVTRACESARVFGIDFYSVLSRGSQYKVESIMFRIAKPENYVLITPNRKQVASQRSLECLPLIMEPISQFYNSPMVVLDFQSLYPSIMIAYNYCYSTCLGRVRNFEVSSRFGVQPDFDLPEGLLESLKEHVNISPNGVMFVKPEIRKSLLAKMLTELLDTRFMIKRSMKDYKDDSGLLRMLDAKQLTLKLLANVTYGYTSASFSGRMPSVEIADSIVSTGRETLERSIKLINETEKWGAQVVYGDTDSVFIYFPGKSKDEAFTIGNEIANTITKLNPAPVKLKFEKIYHPAVLLAKKRYVGFKYEDQNETEPVFEAKGIETVRRDGTAATQKILESCLKILFRTQDMSQLKDYLYKQWTKILSNRILLQEFIIAKEVRMGSYSSRGGPNGAVIAQAQMNEDSRAEPQYGERVPYVVVYRGPKARLKDRVVHPQDFLADPNLKLDSEYYIRKQIIPPLSRVFNLMGVDIESWYESMPRAQKADALAVAQINQQQTKKVTRIDQYYASSHCIMCRRVTEQVICEYCQQQPAETIFSLSTKQRLAQDKFRRLLYTCQQCTKLSPLDAMTIENEQNESEFADIPCESLDCPIFYERCKAKEDVKVTLSYNAILDNIPL